MIATEVSVGQRVLWLLGPQVVLGGALAIVPDGRWPLLTQGLVLLHVVSAVASALASAVWGVAHARGKVLRPPAASGRAPRGAHAARIVLAVAAVASFASGAGAAWGGEGTPAGDVHAVVGLAVALPLALHLLFDGRGLQRVAAVGYLMVAALALPGVRAASRGAVSASATPRFALATRDPALYDTAEWCGGCHEQQFAQWRGSTHARAAALPTVHDHFKREIAEHGPSAVDSDLADPSAEGRAICVRCHVPTTFYGANPRPALEDPIAQSQGISCGFCHTLRDADAKRELFLSAPETVRRYVGQNARNPLMREVGDLLIRWRPAVHRADYHVAFLDRSATCGTCHRESYASWLASRYAGSSPPTDGGDDPSDAVTCNDCHMSHTPRGERAREPGALVPWGVERPQRRHHGWVGGNATAAHAMGDPAAADADRRLREGMISLRLTDVRVTEDVVWATVLLRNERVGHLFPTGEGGDVRQPRLQLELLDERGQIISVTSPVDAHAPGFEVREAVGVSVPLIHTRDTVDTPANVDHRLAPGQERSFRLGLTARPSQASVRVSLRSTFDPLPIASAASKI